MAVRTDTEFQIPITAKDEASPTIDKVAKSSEQAALSVGKLGFSMVSLNQTLELAEKAWSFVKTAVGESVGVFLDAAHANHGLGLAMSLTGQYSKSAMEDFSEFRDQMVKTTEASGSQVTAMLRQAQAIGVSHERTKIMTKAAADLAVALDTDVTSAFQQLIGVNNGFVRGLARSFPGLKQFTEEQLKAGAGVDYLAKRLKGFAEAEAQTAQGQMHQLEKSVKGVKKAVGELIVTLFKGSEAAEGTEFMARAIELVQKFTKYLKSFLPEIRRAHEEIVKIGDALFEAFRKVDWQVIVESLKAVGVAILAIAAPEILTALAGLAFAFAGWAAPLIAATAEFIAMAVAIAAVVAAVDIIFRNFDKLPQVADLFATAFLAAFSKIDEGLMKLIRSILLEVAGLATKIGEAFPGTKLAAMAADAALALGNATGEMSDQIEEQAKFTEKMLKDLEETSKGLDLGLAGALKKQLDNLIKNFQDAYKKIKPEAPKIPLPQGEKAGGDATQAKLPELFTAQDTALIGQMFGQGAGSFAASASTMAAVPLGMLQAANIILDAMLKIINIIPEILKKIGDVFKAILEFPNKVFDAIEHIFTQFTNLTRNIFKNLFAQLDRFGDMLIKFAEELPDAIMDSLKELPDLIIKFFDRLPDIFERMAYEFGRAFPEIAEVFVESIIGNMPKIIAAYIRFMPRIVFAIVRGLLRGLRDGFKNIFSGAKLPDIGAKINDTLKKTVGNLDTSKLFSVKDLEEQVKDAAEQLQDLLNQAQKAGQTIWEALLAALQAGWDWLKKLGGKIWEGFKEAVGDVVAWFKEKGGFIWTGFKEAIGDIAMWFKEKGGFIWTGFVDAVKDIALWFKEKGMAIWTGLTTAVKDPLAVFKGWGSALWDGLVTAVKDPAAKFKEWGGALWTGLTSAIKDPLGKFKEWGKGLWDGMIAAADTSKFTTWGEKLWSGFRDKVTGWWDNFTTLGSNIAVGLWNKLITFDWGSLFGGGGGGGGGAVSGTGTPLDKLHTGGLIKALRFAEGGKIPEVKALSLSAQGADNVPVMAQKGEFIVNAPATKKNLGLLSSLNSGGAPGMGAGGVTIAALNIYPQTATSEDDIKRKIIPAVKGAIKKASQDGEFILSTNGVRS